MHPHHRGGGWYRYCGRRRPSRLLWFVLGAFSATWFFKHKEACRYKVAHCVRYQIPQEAYPHPGLNNHAQQQQPQQPPPQYSESPNQSQSQTTPHPSLPSAAYPAGAAATPSHSTLPPPSPPQTPLTQQDGCHRPWGWGQGCGSTNAWEWGSRPGMEAHRPFPADRWDEDRKRMHDIGRQAQETVGRLFLFHHH